jgi:hypothetical protein
LIVKTEKYTPVDPWQDDVVQKQGTPGRLPVKPGAAPETHPPRMHPRTMPRTRHAMMCVHGHALLESVCVVHTDTHSSTNHVGEFGPGTCAIAKLPAPKTFEKNVY